MNIDSLVRMVFKPALKKKFEFLEIHNVTFKCNRIADEVTMTANGVSKGEVTPSFKSLNTLKLSENSEYTSMFESRLKAVKDFKFKSIDVANFTVDFANNKMFSEVFFTTEDGQKHKRNFTF